MFSCQLVKGRRSSSIGLALCYPFITSLKKHRQDQLQLHAQPQTKHRRAQQIHFTQEDHAAKILQL